MKQLLAVTLFVGAGFSLVASAESSAPEPFLPDSISWVSPPDLSGVQVGWILGAEQKPGPYILRVKLTVGGRIPPHTHPDERNTTVLAGTIYVGFGETFDETKVVAIPTGAVYVAPANVSHYVWVNDGTAIYQEGGVGPTGTSFIKR